MSNKRIYEEATIRLAERTLYLILAINLLPLMALVHSGDAAYEACAMGAFTLGVFFGVMATFSAYLTQYEVSDNGSTNFNLFRKATITLGVIASLLFVVGSFSLI